MFRAHDLCAVWMTEADSRGALEALSRDSDLVSTLIEARTRAGLTQAQLASRMKTTQSVIARLEGGRVYPSTRTLERIAEATGTRLRISFESDQSAAAAD